jgi:predicted O-methyltransferase YrrM
MPELDYNVKQTRLTKSITKQDDLLRPYVELIRGTDKNFAAFDDGGVEIEVGEFLFSMVRIVKPKNILETGLYSGISTMYMAEGIKANERGHIDTIEYEMYHINRSRKRFEQLGLLPLITIHCHSSITFEPDKQYDLMFLDTEPQIRFTELNNFWDHLNPGGFIIIHDLHPHLGARVPPWEDFVDTIGEKIKSHELSVLTFKTPRGFVVM